MIQEKIEIKKYKDTISVSDDIEWLIQQRKRGESVLLILTKGNEAEGFSLFRYAVELEDVEPQPKEIVRQSEEAEPQETKLQESAWKNQLKGKIEEQLEAQYLEKIYCHQKGIPLTISESERLRIREMRPQDKLDIKEIYEGESGRRFLEPFYQSDQELQELLENYCRDVYDFSEYGYWIVETKQPTVADDGIETKQPTVADDGIDTKQPTVADDGIDTKQPTVADDGIDTKQPTAPDDDIDTKQPIVTDDDFETKQSHCGRVIGIVGLQRRSDGIELSFALKEQAQHRGYAREMCAAIIEYWRELKAGQEGDLGQEGELKSAYGNAQENDYTKALEKDYANCQESNPTNAPLYALVAEDNERSKALLESLNFHGDMLKYTMYD